MISVRQAGGLPPAIHFLATGRVRDFHPLDCAHAGHTENRAAHLSCPVPYVHINSSYDTIPVNRYTPARIAVTVTRMMEKINAIGMTLVSSPNLSMDAAAF